MASTPEIQQVQLLKSFKVQLCMHAYCHWLIIRCYVVLTQMIYRQERMKSSHFVLKFR